MNNTIIIVPNVSNAQYVTTKKIESENEAYSIVENKYLFWYDQINCIFVIFIKQIIKNLKINFSVEIVK